ncbi:PEP-CTERM sorting domain-containing protein [Persicirhabdus sediminis]|uniref:PEP-CTERM sorting domain-containing protein n=1 Tax=Persicirhabdus sediminis TaxID=454144 RepID=A0A8J7MDA2_9BACT|nr:PEP-CTERM sorting domain-containing protein [Persicirhabdus sediminis]MBK1790838.1 PEP-CTERM sorting domain-containing protein [Persicirhabdus sediminis]
MKRQTYKIATALGYLASMGLTHGALILGSPDPEDPNVAPPGTSNGLTWDLDNPSWWDEDKNQYVAWNNDGSADAIFMHDGGRNEVNVGEGTFNVNTISRRATEGAVLNQALKLKGLGADKTTLNVGSYISGGYVGTPKVFEVENLTLTGTFEVRDTNRFLALGGSVIKADITMASTTTEFRIQGGDLSEATLRMNGKSLGLYADGVVGNLIGHGTLASNGNRTLTIANLNIGANTDGSGGLASWTTTGTGTVNVNFGGSYGGELGTVAMTVELGSSLCDTFEINGTLTLGGNLVINTLGTGDFVSGDSYTLFTAGNIVGEFDSISLPELDEGLEWVWENTGTSWTITVTDKIPEPAAIMLLGLGGVARILRRRRC